MFYFQLVRSCLSSTLFGKKERSLNDCFMSRPRNPVPQLMMRKLTLLPDLLRLYQNTVLPTIHTSQALLIGLAFFYLHCKLE